MFLFLLFVPVNCEKEWERCVCVFDHTVDWSNVFISGIRDRWRSVLWDEVMWLLWLVILS